MISATKDELDKLEQETRRDVHVIRHQLKGEFNPLLIDIDQKHVVLRWWLNSFALLAASVMQTQLPAEDSSVVTRIHRNQVRSNLLAPRQMFFRSSLVLSSCSSVT